MPFISELDNTFQENSHAENGFAMAKYMKNKFPFFLDKNARKKKSFYSNLEEKQNRSHR
ncbi:hypothetical protein AB3G33_13665 [Flavobacterium sp. WC2421]|uniref:hypothetical protein n=1 Tax=Flavobacterium sp. WC2421 TaxID=3234138 RepID=UPI0034668AD3